jgi:hypothetical protein
MMIVDARQESACVPLWPAVIVSALTGAMLKASYL